MEAAFFVQNTQSIAEFSQDLSQIPRQTQKQSQFKYDEWKKLYISFFFVFILVKLIVIPFLFLQIAIWIWGTWKNTQN